MSRLRTGACAGLCLASTLLAAAPVAIGAAGGVSYPRESEAAFRAQLAARRIRSAVINKRIRSVRLTLADGSHARAKYPPHQEPRVAAELKAKGVHVSVLSKTQAEKEAKNLPKHHKLRYIAGGILVAVIAVVAAVLLVNRRRQRD